ncbi:MAG TPA: DUF4395 domain-containing protein [Herpetosiphonaceae bacterium]
MEQERPATHSSSSADGVPLPIVKLNRWVLVLGVLIGIVTQQPAATTILFVLLLPAVVLGQRWSPIAALGRWLFATKLPGAERQDRRLMRFNNTIALALLGAAQIAFVAGLPMVGWALALMVAGAASVALAGFCVGCFLYYQFKLHRRQILG